jgi:hypothetical protein
MAATAAATCRRDGQVTQRHRQEALRAPRAARRAPAPWPPHLLLRAAEMVEPLCVATGRHWAAPCAPRKSPRAMANPCATLKDHPWRAPPRTALREGGRGVGKKGRGGGAAPDRRGGEGASAARSRERRGWEGAGVGSEGGSERWGEETLALRLYKMSNTWLRWAPCWATIF